MAFNENLKYFREKCGLSQAQLAVLADVAQPTIANYEKGKITPKPETFVALARSLGTTCEELIKGAHEKEETK